MTVSIERRRFLAGAAALGGASLLPGLRARASTQPQTIRVASNQGAENATLQQLIVDRGYFGRYGLDAQIVESKTISGPMDALLTDQADICMISGFVGVLPAIEQGKGLRLVGAAMQLPALALYTGKRDIKRVADLAGRRIGIGGTKGLLHILSVALLRKKGVDPAKVEFVNVGSNAQVFEAVAGGKVEAGLSGIAGMSDASRAWAVEDGKLWRELPDYTYQPAYASLRAIRDRPEALGRCLAAYTQLYRYLSSAGSHAAYLDARRRAAGEESIAEGEAVWKFVRAQQPYALSPGLSPKRVDYLQRLNLDVGLQNRILPFDQVASLEPAIRARRLLG